jgi:hypothetical protein
MLPKRQKGTESVVMVLSTTSRMTMTFSGSEGTSLEDMMWYESLWDCWSKMYGLWYHMRQCAKGGSNAQWTTSSLDPGYDAMFEIWSCELSTSKNWPCYIRIRWISSADTEQENHSTALDD